MRPAVYGCFLGLLAGCATAPDPDQPVASPCSRSTCFYEREIRDWEIIGNQALIVFVGGRRCAYHMELMTGSFCDFGMTPYLDFDELGDSRICVQDGPYINSGPFGSASDRCRVINITPLTEDELLELYAQYGARPPLPPLGSGEITVGESADPLEQEAQQSNEGQPPGQGEGASEAAEDTQGSGRPSQTSQPDEPSRSP